MDTNVKAIWKDVSPKIRKFLSCVAEHESSHSPWAENPVSTASGKYQFLDSTWSGNAKYTIVDGSRVAHKYGHASDAPAWVQEAVAIHSINNGGWSNWKGTGCGYGT